MQQIVIGLLCDEIDYPISVLVFEANTQDMVTIEFSYKNYRRILVLNK